MYETHFGLRLRPFRAFADGAFYYPATSHERALSQLQQAIQDDEGPVLLTGEPGTGKTILGHCFLDRFGETIHSAFLTNSHFCDRAGLFQAILYDLSLPHEGRSEQELRLSLTEFLLKGYEAGRRTVLVVDEAQHLTPDLLEELRLLGNLEGQAGKAFQVVLLAQPAILETLRLPQLASLSQRAGVRARLEPLGLHEAADYLVHQLRAAGGRPQSIVSDEALEILARGTRGIPRLLNQATHRALALAFAAGATLLDAEAALEALAVVGLAEDEGQAAGAQNSTSAVEETEEVRHAPEEKTSSAPVLALEDQSRGNHERASVSLQNPGRPHRPSASPRRPA